MDVYMGLIFPSAISFAPTGTLYCQGQTMPIAQNSALFSLLGTTFGGDGSQTFGIPDLRGRVPVGIGSAPPLNPVTMGQKWGASALSLVANNLPVHNHPATFAATTGAAPITITVGTGGTGLNASVPALTVNGSLTVSTGNATSNTPSSSLVPAKVITSSSSGDSIIANPYGSATAPNTANWAVGGTTNAQSAPVNGTIAGNANMVTGGTVTVGANATANTPISTSPPSLGLAFLIITSGLYPPRP